MWVPQSFEMIDREGISLNSLPDLGALAPALRRLADALREHAQHLNRAIHTISAEMSDSTRAIDQSLRTQLTVGADALATSVDSGAVACQRFCGVVAELHHRIDGVVGAGDLALAEVRTAACVIERLAHLADLSFDRHWRVPPDLLSHQFAHSAAATVAEIGHWCSAIRRWHEALETVERLLGESRAIEAARADAEHAFARALEHTLVAVVFAAAPTERGAHEIAIARAFTGQAWGHPDGHTVTRPHGTQHAAIPLRALLGQGGTVTWDEAPAAAQVSSRWQALTATQQQTLIDTAPDLIGNLAGIPYGARDLANRQHLTNLISTPTALTPSQLHTITTLSRALQQTGNAPPRQLISFDLTHPVPRVAFSVGNIDTATDVTWVVAGMRNDTPAALSGWSATAQQLYDAQVHAAPEHAPATIIWLGYDTPELSGVLSSHAARSGAPRFAHELDAAHLAYGQTHGQGRVHVLAHSYGTTLASIALTRTQQRVSSFTMLGSAGIDTQLVPSLNALQVDRLDGGTPAIFTGQAPNDGLAPLGAALAGRALPHDHAFVLGLPAINTVSVRDGALAFPVTGAPEQHLAPTDGHDVRGSQPHATALGIAAEYGHGYLDPGTQSLSTVARITTHTLTAEQLATFERVSCSNPTITLQQRSCAP